MHFVIERDDNQLTKHTGRQTVNTTRRPYIHTSRHAGKQAGRQASSEVGRQTHINMKKGKLRLIHTHVLFFKFSSARVKTSLLFCN